MINFIEVPEKQIWNGFLDWYYRNISDYRWHPVAVADRVNILNFNNEMIAYKDFGLVNGEPVDNFYIRESEYKAWATT